MFDRFLRFVAVRRAIERELFEHAYELLDDRLVQEHKKAADLRKLCSAGLHQRLERRLALSEIELARADLALLSRRDPGHPDLGRLHAELTRLAQAGHDVARSRNEVRSAIRAAIAVGELDLADVRIAQARRSESSAQDLAELARQTATLREEAASIRRSVDERLDAGDLKGALERFLVARARQPLAPQIVPLAQRLAERRALAWQRGEIVDLQELDLERLLKVWASELATLPEIAATNGAARVAAEIAARVRRRITDLVEDSQWDVLLLELRSISAGVDALVGEEELASAVEAIEAGLVARENGEYGFAGELLAGAAASMHLRKLSGLAKELASDDAAARHELEAARARLLQGDSMGAREVVLRALARWPGHLALRRELEAFEKGSQDRAERLAAARTAAGEGKLANAHPLLLGLATAGREGDDARLLLQEVQGRMDQVQRGIGQVQKALHGRDSASREGVRHCLARVQQLALVQKDSSDLERLSRALEAELSGLDDLDEAEAARLAGDPSRALAALDKLAERRPALLDPDRLKARILEFEDRVRIGAEAFLATGKPHAARDWSAALRRLESLAVGDPAPRFEIERRCDERIAEAQVVLEEASAFLTRHDLEAAERSLERARGLAADSPAVRSFEQRLVGLRDREQRVREVEALAKADDVMGAHRRLADMPPTSPHMRTRIFDLKQSLARAQGLDHGFLLRVDEGGEWVTLRSDSVTIGNLRDGSSDLKLLANLAGRHARIRRSMSFHGGMQDRILAERGEVFVNGEKVQDRALGSGDRIRLGALVELRYTMPSVRSLTARLEVLGGFQVAGATRILLLKDRGRDGRILLGSGADCHVQVAHAKGEVELFADRDGQVKVKIDGQGEMGGAPFRDEHPVLAGALVKACGLTFTLMPWPLA